MKMMKWTLLFSLVLSALLFGGCTKEDDPNYAELLKGTWVNTRVNDNPVLTDGTFVMEFKSDKTELYAAGFQLNENNKSWEENATYTYDIDGDRLSINGTDVLGNVTQIEFKIQAIHHETLTFTVSKFSVNGDELPNNNTFSCQKVTNDYSHEFAGVWYGRCTTEGATDSLFHYWEYFDDGTYNYYYQDQTKNWVKKSDNEGRYFLYGNLMASNYSHDLLSGGTGLAFECRNFTLDENKMVWTGLRANNGIITYEMEKVSSAPEIL